MYEYSDNQINRIKSRLRFDLNNLHMLEKLEVLSIAYPDPSNTRILESIATTRYRRGINKIRVRI